jgi:hypothetical protein
MSKDEIQNPMMYNSFGYMGNNFYEMIKNMREDTELLHAVIKMMIEEEKVRRPLSYFEAIMRHDFTLEKRRRLSAGELKFYDGNIEAVLAVFQPLINPSERNSSSEEVVIDFLDMTTRFKICENGLLEHLNPEIEDTVGAHIRPYRSRSIC